MKIYLLILFWFSSLTSVYSQSDSIPKKKWNLGERIEKWGGLTFSLEDDSMPRKTPVIYASYSYSQNLAGKILPSNGLHSSLGLNIARLFKQNFSFGVMLEYRGFKILGSNGQFGRLTNAVNASIIKNQSNPVDSSFASLLYAAFNNDPNKNFVGSYLTNYGLFFSPFPNKYGGFMLQVKRGSYDFPIYGAYRNKYISNGSSDFITFSIPVTFNIQLTCKPLTFFKMKKYEGFNENVLLSLFYEEISLKSSSFDRYLKSDFF